MENGPMPCNMKRRHFQMEKSKERSIENEISGRVATDSREGFGKNSIERDEVVAKIFQIESQVQREN